MKYFLRFTESPEKDMERGTSLHMTGCDKRDFKNRREAQKAFGDEHEIVWCKSTDQWAQVIDGLCGFEVESLKDGVERGKEGIGVYNGAFVIYAGYDSDGECAEGDCFNAKEILYKEQ